MTESAYVILVRNIYRAATGGKFSGSSCTNKNDFDEKSEKARFL